MDSSPCAALLSRLTEGKRDTYLESLPAERAKELRELLQYPADSAGRMMDARIIAFDRDITIAAVISSYEPRRSLNCTTCFYWMMSCTCVAKSKFST
jgi:Mg/Co/Ni transporter MgtE